MPEQNKKEGILTGVVTETRSSDSFIAREVEAREREYYAVTGKVITGKPIAAVSGDIFAPGSFIEQSTTVYDTPDERLGNSQILDPHSPVHITEVRTQLYVARGMDDTDGFEEIKKAA